MQKHMPFTHVSNGAQYAVGQGKGVLALLGGAFTAVGAGITGYGWLAERKTRQLRQHGRLIQALFQWVERNEMIEVNGENPRKIIAHWHGVMTNTVYVCKSANVWFDPSPFVERATVPVYVDINKPTRYFVDLSFLPKELE